MFTARKEIGCGIEVGPTINAYGDDATCDHPVVAVWDWKDGADPLYVCEKHDRELQKQEEEKPCPTNPPHPRP